MRKIKLATFCTGLGSPEQAAVNIGLPHEVVFGCEIDKYARASYLANFAPTAMYKDMTRLDVTGRKMYSDLVIAGIPCQSFSIAGRRMGELDHRGLLFYDFYNYVKEQRPKVFEIENVKGLLSDAKGKTFQNWLQLLGRSVNRSVNMFNHPDSLEYNLHWTVLNTKDFGLPQNRERVFLVGIRKDLDNDFHFPAGYKLEKKLKDCLEPVVDKKYYLSETMINWFLKHTEKSAERHNGFKWEPITDAEGKIASCVNARCFKMGVDDNYISDQVFVSKEKRTEEAKAERRETGSNSFRNKEVVFEPSEVMNCLQTSLTNDHYIIVPEANELILAGTLSGGKWDKNIESQCRVYSDEGISPTITAVKGGNQEPKVFTEYRIRKLTPRECFRLQGFSDDNFDKCKKVCSDSQLYKQAGNSMSVTVQEAIINNFKHLL